ncbi:hypothetical protein F5144DRAFT_614534 [Chaetomium tenue]|uniref:Uncharacterized protein n=1 Tax=Chaetomium tenue TaxID=1854479 RepID=A0ACB7NWA2_9PEZI|nr:hypothetical protein F5144DRAFT_614534 [Chaetomium globosum]
MVGVTPDSRASSSTCLLLASFTVVGLPVMTQFSIESNLRAHIRKHKLDGHPVSIKYRRIGANSVEDITAAAKFYSDIRRNVEGAGEPDGPPTIPIATPSKLREVQQSGVPTTTPRKKQQAPVKLGLPVTFARAGRPSRPKLAEMKRISNLGRQAKCQGCKTNKRAKCPPPTRPAEGEACEVWKLFKLHSCEEEEGEDKDKDEDEDEEIPPPSSTAMIWGLMRLLVVVVLAMVVRAVMMKRE